jgi:transposase
VGAHRAAPARLRDAEHVLRRPPAGPQWHAVPTGRKPRFDHAAYRRRSAIERTVGALKEARAVATRYETLAIHYLALVQISMIRLLVRRLERPLSHTA